MNLQQTPSDQDGNEVKIGTKYKFNGEEVEFTAIDNLRGWFEHKKGVIKFEDAKQLKVKDK